MRLTSNIEGGSDFLKSDYIDFLADLYELNPEEAISVIERGLMKTRNQLSPNDMGLLAEKLSFLMKYPKYIQAIQHTQISELFKENLERLTQDVDSKYLEILSQYNDEKIGAWNFLSKVLSWNVTSKNIDYILHVLVKDFFSFPKNVKKSKRKKEYQGFVKSNNILFQWMQKKNPLLALSYSLLNEYKVHKKSHESILHAKKYVEKITNIHTSICNFCRSFIEKKSLKDNVLVEKIFKKFEYDITLILVELLKFVIVQAHPYNKMTLLANMIPINVKKIELDAIVAIFPLDFPHEIEDISNSRAVLYLPAFVSHLDVEHVIEYLEGFMEIFNVDVSDIKKTNFSTLSLKDKGSIEFQLLRGGQPRIIFRNNGLEYRDFSLRIDKELTDVSLDVGGAKYQEILQLSIDNYIDSTQKTVLQNAVDTKKSIHKNALQHTRASIAYVISVVSKLNTITSLRRGSTFSYHLKESLNDSEIHENFELILKGVLDGFEMEKVVIDLSKLHKKNRKK